jgi:hypothetical protein
MRAGTGSLNTLQAAPSRPARRHTACSLQHHTLALAMRYSRMAQRKERRKQHGHKERNEHKILKAKTAVATTANGRL